MCQFTFLNREHFQCPWLQGKALLALDRHWVPKRLECGMRPKKPGYRTIWLNHKDIGVSTDRGMIPQCGNRFSPMKEPLNREVHKKPVQLAWL